MIGRLPGKVALITGGGIGSATARRFVAERASVVVADVTDDAAAALVGDLRLSLDVNVVGTLLGMQAAALAPMRAIGAGSIINISSGALPAMRARS